MMDQNIPPTLYEFFLTDQEMQLILDTLPLSETLEQVLRRLEKIPSREDFVVFLTEDLLDELFSQVLDQLEMHPDDPHFKTWLRLADRLENDAEPCEPVEEEEALDTTMPPEIRERLAELVAQNQVQTVEELNQCLQQVVAEYHQTPQQELGGLSPDQMHVLLNLKWGENYPIVINRNLSCEEVGSTILMKNLRIFLTSLLENNGKTKLTPKGFLNRKFILQVTEPMELDSADRWLLQNYSRSVKEFEIQFLFAVRMVAEFSHLVRKSNGHLMITKKGITLLEESQAGELYALFFETFFNVFNLANLDGCEECSGFQYQLAFSVYRSAILAKDWIDPATDYEKFAHLMLIRELAEKGKRRDLKVIVFKRFFLPFHWFGLMEAKIVEEPNQLLSTQYHFRISPLFNLFFDFSALTKINKNPLPIYKNLH
ncbi:MAG: hypothetical protein RBU29_07740 [bacterium]|jgi:hypothetical protein|nr:hypothetical protein [bacterium]